MTALSKLDIAAIRAADDIVISLTAEHGGRARVIKRKHITERNPFAEDVDYYLPALVVMRRMPERVKCFTMTGIYHEQITPLSSALMTLRVGDELTFEFCPDHDTNQHDFEAGLHGDVCLLIVRRNDKIAARWTINTSTCPENTARMCQQVPYSGHWHRRKISEAAE